MTCEKGSWGNYYEDGETFIGDYCKGEIVPNQKDECNGEDDNCDGIVDDGKDLKDTDNCCEECKQYDESVLQNFILTGFKICKSCKSSKTIFPV